MSKIRREAIERAIRELNAVKDSHELAIYDLKKMIGELEEMLDES